MFNFHQHTFYNEAKETFTTAGRHLIDEHERFVDHAVWNMHTDQNEAGASSHDTIPQWCIKSKCEEVINEVSEYITIEKEKYDL